MATTPTASSIAFESKSWERLTQSASAASIDNLILTYLRERGFDIAEPAVRDVLERHQLESTPKTTRYLVPESELRKHLIPFWPKKETLGEENALLDERITLQSILSVGVPSSVASILCDISPGGADNVLMLDPTDRHEGFRYFESWVEGSLDLYKVCYVYVI